MVKQKCIVFALLMQASNAFEIDVPLPRSLEESSSHWGVTMARLVGVACPCCEVQEETEIVFFLLLLLCFVLTILVFYAAAPQ